MGSYAVVTDVQLRVGAMFTLSDSTVPSFTDVLTLIADAEAEINAALHGAGYKIVPATDSNSIAFLRGKVAGYVAAQTLQITFGHDVMPAHMKQSLETWSDFVMRIQDKKIVLSGQESETSQTMYRVKLWNRPE